MARLATVAVAVTAFIVLGLPEGGLGTAWPALRTAVGRPVEDLGVVLIALLAGYQLTSIPSGRIVARLGTGWAVALAALVTGVGLAGYTVAPNWSFVLATTAVTGMGGGLTDTAFNAHAALNFDPRQTNLLHAGFGIGATIGPIVMTTALATGRGWRTGYLVFAGVQLVMLAVLLARRRSFAPIDPPGPSEGRVSIWLVATFFLYTGLEVAAGQWAFTWLTEGRNLAITAAGGWVAAYWGGLTLGRLAFGAIAHRLPARRIVESGTAGAIGGVALLWWDPSGLGVLGLPVIGMSLAGIFPALVTLTPGAVGVERSGDAIGLQLSAAALGAAAVPWLAGRIVGVSDLESLGPVLVGTGLVLMVVQRVALRVDTGVDVQ